MYKIFCRFKFNVLSLFVKYEMEEICFTYADEVSIMERAFVIYI